MVRLRLSLCWCLACGSLVSGSALGSGGSPLVDRPWFEARTENFITFSCGPTQEVARLAARLEQFRQAYSMLAGAHAVASPPVIVMAFPDHESLRPYLPLYQDKPANLAAFFVRGSDENLIVTSLSGLTSEALDNVFHEYTHLLLRRNDRIWPAWLKEGMADIYATFELAGTRVRIAHERDRYLRFLRERNLMPLAVLLEADRESPEYNERDRQGIFYAQSWLLTHYLLLGKNSRLKSRFPEYTTALRAGHRGSAAFTNTFGISLENMERELKNYLNQAKYERIELSLGRDLTGARSMHFRGLPKVEVCYRLGNQLLRIDRGSAAEELFLQAQKIMPNSPLPEEGLGLLAADREESSRAVTHLSRALERGSSSYLGHYVYAREKLRLHSQGADSYSRLDASLAAEVRAPLKKALKLMPTFGPAHHLLGFLEMIQREDLSRAESHLERALQLEPENEYYLFALAQAQLARRDEKKARESLKLLTQPFTDPKVRLQAQQMLSALEKGQRKSVQ